jgi:hypothetical protein
MGAFETYQRRAAGLNEVTERAQYAVALADLRALEAEVSTVGLNGFERRSLMFTLSSVMINLASDAGSTGDLTGTLLEQTLLTDDRAVRVGAIQTLDYDRAVVITHDRWKEDVGGIPQHAFLLATAREIGSGGGDDDEVLLLRVETARRLARPAYRGHHLCSCARPSGCPVEPGLDGCRGCGGA